MKRRSGPIGRAGGIAENLAGVIRRRRQSRESRVVVHDAAGHARVLPRDAEGYEGILEAGERLLAAVDDVRA